MDDERRFSWVWTPVKIAFLFGLLWLGEKFSFLLGPVIGVVVMLFILWFVERPLETWIKGVVKQAIREKEAEDLEEDQELKELESEESR